MKPITRLVVGFLFLILTASACSPALPATTLSPGAPQAETTAPAEPAPPGPSPTPAVALLDLEIVEWYEHAIPNLQDPSITDTHIEMLVRNPNDIPVHVDTDALEFSLLNAAGEVVFTNSSPYFSLWEGSWMLAGESTGFQICACFESSGGEKQDWEAIQMVAPIEPASDVSYTMDVEATLGEPYSLGGSLTGIPITMTNTGDQPLKSIPMRVIARDAGGRYIGMPAFGNSVVSFTEDISIQPGDSLDGVFESEINYFNGPLTYEVVAIGIPASSAATEEIDLPSGTPLTEWEGIPIMPGAISGEVSAEDIYQFTIQATIDEIASYYETELASLGYQLTGSDDQGGYMQLSFSNGTAMVLVFIAPLEGLTGVVITISG